MRLNDIRPAPGSHKQPVRVGRGIAAGRGKTAGRGTKGQHARTGGLRKVGFEGGQMPLQRRLPRSGFASHMKETRLELRLGALGGFEGERVDLAGLKAAGLAAAHIERVKIILNGTIERALVVADAQVVVTRGARAAIEAAGGRIED